ncbi:hypothetical protein SAMN05444266_101143 [Chitinophaga jiangningensis]|uniref:Uncharacterized protein n=1 Tax=Chitinophaga jiangningensis TaxID=1419482 RepID=A0A1M6VBN0_9BACT|nr:hypothetical protein [Chitinophaga jiangningensis]SHK78781.1 hypothetical protein SAMN05444266_101143 [Chitinophaga jiangningensis]
MIKSILISICGFIVAGSSFNQVHDNFLLKWNKLSRESMITILQSKDLINERPQYTQMEVWVNEICPVDTAIVNAANLRSLFLKAIDKKVQHVKHWSVIEAKKSGEVTILINTLVCFRQDSADVFYYTFNTERGEWSCVDYRKLKLNGDGLLIQDVKVPMNRGDNNFIATVTDFELHKILRLFHFINFSIDKKSNISIVSRGGV